MLMSRTPLPTLALRKIQPFSNDCRVMSATANANVIFLYKRNTAITSDNLPLSGPNDWPPLRCS